MFTRILGGAIAAFATSVPAVAEAPARESNLAIVGATVLPMVGRERLADQTVLVSGDRVTAVGPRSRIKIPPEARVIDAKGKVLMPGLVDMHVHLAGTPGSPGDAAQRALAVMLAHGVTSLRGMAGNPQNLIVRGKVEAGQLAGPRIYAASPPLHEQNTPNADRARAAVREAKAAGYDLIKSHHLTDPFVWQAAQDEARAQGIPVAGHVTNEVGLDRALAASQQVEHLDSLAAALIPAGSPAKQLEFGQVPPPPVVVAINGAGSAPLDELASKIAAAKSWHVPTLSLFDKILDAETPTRQLAAAPPMRFVPPPVLQQWSGQREQMLQSGMSAAEGRAVRNLRRRIAGALHKAGVPLMAGSDTAQRFHLFGPGLHEEIEALAAAGLSRMDALRAATVVPRNYFRSLPNGGSTLGWKADFGTVTKGARADLILLDGDASADLAYLNRPRAVIAGGRFYDRSALDALLEKAAADAKDTGSAPAPAAGAQKQIYVIRHLQKGSGDDPSLSAEGVAGAVRLAQLLVGEGIKAIFASTTKRAQETAAPLAERLGLPVTPYDPRDPEALARAVATAGGNVLVVGHSNTVPDLVERFGGARPPPLTEQDYGTLFVVTAGSGQTETKLLPVD